MNKNPAIALMQIETALNYLQNTIFKLFDELMQKLQDTREIAESLRKSA